MSSFLFVVNPKVIASIPSEDIKKLVLEWKEYSSNYDKSNRFESDRAAGFRENLLHGETELFCRELDPDYNFEDISHLIHREFAEWAHIIRMAFVESKILGVSYLKVSDGIISRMPNETLHRPLS